MTEAESTVLCSIHDGDQRRSRAIDIGQQVALFWGEIKDVGMPEEIASDCVAMFQDRAMTELMGVDPGFLVALTEGDGLE